MKNPQPQPERPRPQEGYNPAFFDELARIEDRHFWFRFRNSVITRLTSDLVRSTARPRVLEAGCGNGNVLRFIAPAVRHGMVVGMDLFEEGLHLARRRSAAPIVCGDVHQSPFNCQFDLIGAFDVIEHLYDDRQALRDLCRLLSDDGALLLTVPAHMSLWSYFDQASGHYRRYSPSSLTEVLTACGFRIEYMSEFMSVLYPLLWFGRRISGWKYRHGGGSAKESLPDLAIVPVVNTILRLALAWELPLLRRRWRLPMGSSLLAIARKA